MGKTTVASSMALAAAGRGKRTLLVSTDPAHNLSDIFQKKIGSKIHKLTDRLHTLEIDPHEETHRYLDDVKKTINSVVRSDMQGEIHRQIDLTAHTPGAEEAALFNRITSILMQSGKMYDLICFDTAPTGHTIRLLTLPETMEIWIQGLLDRRDKMHTNNPFLIEGEEKTSDPVRSVLNERKNKFRYARDLLMDHERCGFVFVLTAEKLPVEETFRAVKLMKSFHFAVEYLIVNRLFPDDPDCSFLKHRGDVELKYKKEIRKKFKDIKIVGLPMWEKEIVGMDELKKTGDFLLSGGLPI